MIKKMKNILSSTIIATTLITTASNADFIGAEVGFASWSPSLTGTIKKGIGEVDFEKDLGYGTNKTNNFIWAYIDQPLPVIPNIKIQKTSYSDNANGIMSKSIIFSGASFGISENIQSSLKLDQLDVIPYWRILDNWVNLDLGFNFKSIDGNIKIDSSVTNQHVNDDFSVIIPMLYAKARFDMPFTGLSIESDLSYISLAGNSISDFKAGIVYETKIGLGATIGIRKENLTLDDIDDVYSDINIEGIYAGLFYHF